RLNAGRRVADRLCSGQAGQGGPNARPRRRVRLESPPLLPSRLKDLYAMKTLTRAAAVGLTVLTAAGVVAPAALAQAAPPAAESMFRATTLNLSAYGETKVAPDMATITLGVTTEAPTAAAAMQANAAQMSRVIAALKKAGLADRDIQTSQLNLSPQYRYEQNEAPKLVGYQASNQVTLTVRDLGRLGQVVDATVAAG